MRRVSVNASFSTKLMVGTGIIMTKLVYLITFWDEAQQYLMNALQVQQLEAARTVCGIGCWRWSKRKLLDKVGWLSVRQLEFFHTVLHAHKTINSGAPKPLHCCLLFPDQNPFFAQGIPGPGQLKQKRQIFPEFEQV